jgi:hypothetical protein
MARRKALITIRISSDEDTVTVDGNGSGAAIYDRSRMNKNDKYLMRRVIVEALFPNRGR